MAEFELIEQHFTRPTRHTNLGIGDDAALISVAEGMELAISADMLVSGTHFFADADPYQLGWKSLAVNVSDMAAMGAQPRWTTLAIALHCFA
jgi:thiamine-monophosphate kinase